MKNNSKLSISIIITLILLVTGSAFAEVEFDGLKWYMSSNPENLSLNEQGHLVWKVGLAQQLTVHFPPMDLSDVGDVAKVVYLFKSDGANTGEIGTDPMIISGTGDLRVGFFDSNGGEQVTSDGYSYRSKQWCGYLGFCARLCPHLQIGIKREHSDAIPGKIMKRKNALVEGNCESLVQSAGSYRGSSKDISGFDLKFGEFSPLIIRLERTAKDTVVFSVTLNNVTYDFVDDNPEVQPQKVDTMAFFYPNPKNIQSLTFAGAYFSMVKSATNVTNPTIENTIVYGEQGKFCAWPANSGVWSWGDEILVGFTCGGYEEQKGHNLSDTDPQPNVFSRSLDGGKTWKFEDPKIFADKTIKAQNSNGSINFAHPDFAMKVGNFGIDVGENDFLVSYDRGKNWQGPYNFGDLIKAEQLKGLHLTSRTDYMTISQKECLLFLSARPGGFGSDRAFVAKTTDGGAIFNFVSWIAGPDDPYRAVMPSTVRLSDTKLVSALRRRDMKNSGRDAWVGAFVSEDNGNSWSMLSEIGITGGWNGNPPAMVKMQDGRLCCVYANRTTRTINARYSSDQGKTWSREYVLRNDYQMDSFNDPDLGYSRLVERADGKLVAMYYWATRNNIHHHIAATIWDPTQDK